MTKFIFGNLAAAYVSKAQVSDTTQLSKDSIADRIVISLTLIMSEKIQPF
jgi:hypothetical protein